MKYITLFILVFCSYICSSQSFVMTNGTETINIPIISEGDQTVRYFDCPFEQVFELEQLEYEFTVQEELVNDNWYLQGYLAYSYLRMGVDFDWVNNNIEFDEEFYPTLYLVGCKGYTYNFEQ